MRVNYKKIKIKMQVNCFLFCFVFYENWEEHVQINKSVSLRTNGKLLLLNFSMVVSLHGYKL